MLKKYVVCLLLVVVSILFPAFLYGQSEAAKKIENFIQPFAEAEHFSGVVLAAAKGEVIYERAFGLANASHQVSNRTDTKFNVASVTKDFTLVIANALIDAGKLNEVDTLDKYIPDFPQADKISIAMLAGHRSGIPHRVNAKEDQSYRLNDIVDLAKKCELAFPPGSDRLYSSAGYSVLARVLEIASGQSYDELLKRYVIQPAGLENTIDFGSEQVIRNYAEPYLLDATGFLNAPVKDYSFLAGAGSVVSTARDIYQFGQAIAAGKLGESARDGMVNSRGNIIANGSTNGYRCSLRFDTSDGTALVLVSNLASGANDLIIKNVQHILQGEPVEDHVVPSPDVSDTTLENLDDFSGTYALGNSTFEIFSQHGQLYAGPYKLVPLGVDRFFIYWSYAEITFERNEDKSVTGLVWEGSAGKTEWERK